MDRELAMNHLWMRVVEAFVGGSMDEAREWERQYTRFEGMSDDQFAARYPRDAAVTP